MLVDGRDEKMAVGFILALLSSVFLALNTFLLGKVEMYMRARNATFLILLSALLMNILFNLVGHGRMISIGFSKVSWQVFGALALSGLLGYYASYLFILIGGKHIGVARCTLISSSSILLVYLYEILFAGHAFSFWNLAWGLLIIIGILLTLDSDAPGSMSLKSWGLGVGAALALAVCQSANMIILKSIVDLNELTAIDINIIRLLAAVIISVFLIIFSRHPKANVDIGEKKTVSFYILAAAVSGPLLSIICQNNSLYYIRASVTNAVIQLYPIIVLWISVIVDGVKINMKTIVGGALAVFGAILFSFD